jgi:Transposase, Mutator family
MRRSRRRVWPATSWCGQLAERARAEGLRLTGEGGLLSQLTKAVVESALEGELDDHLGYSKHDPASRDGGNSRNGKRGKSVLTDALTCLSSPSFSCQQTGAGWAHRGA